MHLLKLASGLEALRLVGPWPPPEIAIISTGGQWPTFFISDMNSGLSTLKPPQQTLSLCKRLTSGASSDLSYYGSNTLPWPQSLCSRSFCVFGGDGETRTPDLLRAKQALSQLSYIPSNTPLCSLHRALRASRLP
jgi:hypothetical protein